MDYARSLCEGIGGWLQFEYSCNRSGLFSEKYLTHPIGQILSAWSGNRAQAEYKHPILAELSEGKGRRPEVDFVVCDPYPKISLAVEAKWIGKTRPTIQGIIWDLIRLEILAHEQGARCFFILGGNYASLNKLFNLKKFLCELENGHRRPVLRHDKNIIHKTSLAPVDGIRIPLLKSLFSQYQEFQFPHRILTRRTSPFPSQPTAKDPQVYVWEVMPASNRETFKPKNSKHYSLDGSSKRDYYRLRAALANI